MAVWWCRFTMAWWCTKCSTHAGVYCKTRHFWSAKLLFSIFWSSQICHLFIKDGVFFFLFGQCDNFLDIFFRFGQKQHFLDIFFLWAQYERYIDIFFLFFLWAQYQHFLDIFCLFGQYQFVFTFFLTGQYQPL